ncbi:hypothetical protein [Noviluteimonas gilva]|uniref:hypothetical protein n=1 Tax=Noviluteimonas gilva TaxID=2682097 RepID=UPI001E37A015|nr:hypothetical protein [Lysobacter gilvus]
MKPAHDLPVEDRLVPDARAADALGVTLMTLWRWTRKGVLPVVRISNRNYRRVGDVRRLQRPVFLDGDGVASVADQEVADDR